MTLDMRPRAGPMREIAYSPARDVTYLYSAVVERAECALYDGKAKELTEWMRSTGVTDLDIAETIRIFALVLNDAHKNPKESLWDVMDRLKFNEQPAPARVALLYYIGALMTGSWFQAIREVVMLGDDTLPEIKRLTDTAERMAEYATLGPWGRRWVRFKRRWLTPRSYLTTIGGVHVSS